MTIDLPLYPFLQLTSVLRTSTIAMASQTAATLAAHLIVHVCVDIRETERFVRTVRWSTFHVWWKDAMIEISGKYLSVAKSLFTPLLEIMANWVSMQLLWRVNWEKTNTRWKEKFIKSTPGATDDGWKRKLQLELKGKALWDDKRSKNTTVASTVDKGVVEEQGWYHQLVIGRYNLNSIKKLKFDDQLQKK